MMLTPWNGNLITEGRVSYGETAKAWNTIRLQKEIAKEFPALLNRSARVSFRLEYVRNLEGLKAKIKEIEKEKQGIPLLLYLFLDEPLE